MEVLTSPGPLLMELLEVRAADRAALQQPCLTAYSQALIDFCHQFGSPVVWPVGASGERLVGAASVLATRGLEVWDRNSRLDGQSVVLVLVSDVTGLALRSAMLHVRRLGATVVHACGISVVGAEGVEGLASFRALTPSRTHRRSA